VAHDGDTSTDGNFGGSDWYDVVKGMGPRNATGYYFSQIVGGNRVQFAPKGLSVDFGGNAFTTYPTASGLQWPDIGNIALVGNEAHDLAAGTPLTLSYDFQTHDGSAVIGWYLDSDQNPLNNSHPIALKGDSSIANTEGNPWAQNSEVIPTTAVPTGKYYAVRSNC